MAVRLQVRPVGLPRRQWRVEFEELSLATVTDSTAASQTETRLFFTTRQQFGTQMCCPSYV